MGTRGFVGFIVDGDEKVAYNHLDSYPPGLGVAVLTWLRVARDNVPALREQVKKLQVVDPDSTPTGQDIERLSEYADTSVSRGRLDDWYTLLRETQGNPHAILEAGVIEDASGFPADSLFCEYGYLVDLDAEVFETYQGFQTSPHNRGRFAALPLPREYTATPDYYPVALAASWPLAELPSEEELCTALGCGDEA